MDKCVIEGSVNVGDTEDVFAISNLRAEGDGGLFLWGLGLFWRLDKVDSSEQSTRFHARKHESWPAYMVGAERTILNV